LIIRYVGATALPYCLVKHSQSLLTHSIIHKYGPPSLHGTWIFNHERNPDVSLRNANDLYLPLALTEQIKRLLTDRCRGAGKNIAWSLHF
jgi:hypothetical protein